MDGHIADLKSICDLADKYNAVVFVDDAHSTGFLGKTGRGTAEHCGVQVGRSQCFSCPVLSRSLPIRPCCDALSLTCFLACHLPFSLRAASTS